MCIPESLGNQKVSKNIFPLMCKVCGNLKSQLSYLTWILENDSFKAKSLKPLPAGFKRKHQEMLNIYICMCELLSFSLSFQIGKDNLRGKKCKRQPGVILPFPQNE